MLRYILVHLEPLKTQSPLANLVKQGANLNIKISQHSQNGIEVCKPKKYALVTGFHSGLWLRLFTLSEQTTPSWKGSQACTWVVP